MKKKIVKSEFGKNVLTLMTGSTLAQILPIALTPVLTRLFSPEEFGAYTFYMSIVTFLLVIAAGRYEQAIVLPKEDKDAINILALCFTILSVFVSILLIVFLVFGNVLADLISVDGLSSWLWLIPVTVFFGSAYKIFTFWSNRHKRFKGTSVSVVVQTTGRVAVQMVGGLQKYNVFTAKEGIVKFFKSIFSKAHGNPSGITHIGVGALILSFTLGFFLGTLVFLFPFLKNDKVLFKEVSWKRMKEQAKIHDKFPKINSVHGVLDELKNIGVTSTILYAFNEAILGFYGMTVRVLRAPLSVIGNSFAQVFFQKAAEMHANEQNFIPLIKSTVKKMLLIGAPIFLVIILFGPPLFEFVLGEKWRVAGEYAQYLTPWLYLSFAIAPVLQVSVILNKQGQYFIISMIHNVIILGSILVGGIFFKDLTTGFLILSSLQILFYTYAYFWALKLTRAALNEKKP
jgi:O-antigen/teichoic acid export membrane protein